MREKARLPKEGRLEVRLRGIRFRITRFDYYAAIISLFSGSIIYLVMAERWQDALILTTLLSGLGLSEMLRSLVERDGEGR